MERKKLQTNLISIHVYILEFGAVAAAHISLHERCARKYAYKRQS